jgi:LmbE family N-acetylglucosaminyl deacetylase
MMPFLNAALRPSIRETTADPSEIDFSASAIVFAPHPDDETLGCGGTIIRKRRYGAPVHLAFMTDGSRSHPALPPSDLAWIRHSEAVQAARVLGIGEGDLSFLPFEDGSLNRHRAAAVSRVEQLIEAQNPAQVFLPYRGESPADHRATHRIVMTALRRLNRSAEIFEYPIWIWNHWPRIPLPLFPIPLGGGILANTVRTAAGLHFARTFTCRVGVADVLDRKREALDRHRSQMTALLPDVSWPTLFDVANGAFLDCFFDQYERFHRYRIG